MKRLTTIWIIPLISVKSVILVISVIQEIPVTKFSDIWTNVYKISNIGND